MKQVFDTCSAILCTYCSRPCKLRRLGCRRLEDQQSASNCYRSSKCDSDGIGLESHICNFFSVSRGKRRALELLWTHFSLSVTFGPSRGESCLANISRIPPSLATFTTHSFGTDWYVIMALEPACQNSKPAICAACKWTQHTASCSGLQWIWKCTFLAWLNSVINSASLASLLKGSRGVKKIVFRPSFRSFPPATNPATAIEYWSRARPTWWPCVRNHLVIHQSWRNKDPTQMSLDCTKKLQSSILIFTDFKSRLEASKIKAIERILVCEFLISLNLKSFFQYWEYDVHMHRTIFFTFVPVMVSNHFCDTFGDASFTGIVSALLASRNRIPNSVFPWIFFFV